MTEPHVVPIVIPEKNRRHIVHGWAFRNLSAADNQSIGQFLANGNPHILPSNYKAIALAWWRNQPGH